ncbi:MAG: hypothetical protein ACOYN3_03490 [Acidimicrobiia bacterium]
MSCVLMLPQQIVLLAAALGSFGTVLYATAMLRGEVHPNRVSWLLWGVIPLIAFAAEISEGVGLRSALTLSAGVGPLIIVALSFRTHGGYWRISRLDWICGAFSLFAVVIWGFTRTGALAVMLSIAADVLASTPTLRKARREPRTERLSTYALGGVAAAMTLATVQEWTIVSFAFPLYLFAMCTTLTTIIAMGRRRTGLRLTDSESSEDSDADHTTTPAAGDLRSRPERSPATQSH